MLFESNLGVTSSLKKLVKSIRGSDTLKINFDKKPFDSFVIIFVLAAIAPTITAITITPNPVDAGATYIISVTATDA